MKENELKLFNGYLIRIGMRREEFPYLTDDEIYDNIEYFKEAFNYEISAYYALFFLNEKKYYEGLSEKNIKGEESNNVEQPEDDILLANKRAIEYAKFEYGEDFDDSCFEPDVKSYVKDFKCGYLQALNDLKIINF